MKARTISTLTCTALSLRSTVANIATPCSVKAYGMERLPPQDLEVTICDLKITNSAGLSWNMKSVGKRDTLRLTA